MLLVLLAFILYRGSSALTTSGARQLDTTNDSLWSIYQLKTLEREFVHLNGLT